MGIHGGDRFAARDQQADEAVADEAGAAYDEDGHFSLPSSADLAAGARTKSVVMPQPRECAAA
jgi:hypothetical protein